MSKPLLVAATALFGVLALPFAANKLANDRKVEAGQAITHALAGGEQAPAEKKKTKLERYQPNN